MNIFRFPTTNLSGHSLAGRVRTYLSTWLLEKKIFYETACFQSSSQFFWASSDLSVPESHAARITRLQKTHQHTHIALICHPALPSLFQEVVAGVSLERTDIVLQRGRWQPLLKDRRVVRAGREAFPFPWPHWVAHRWGGTGCEPRLVATVAPWRGREWETERRMGRQRGRWGGREVAITRAVRFGERMLDIEGKTSSREV